MKLRLLEKTVIYAIKYDKVQNIVPDWHYTIFYNLFIQERNCRVKIEDWTAATATLVFIEKNEIAVAAIQSSTSILQLYTCMNR